MLLFELFFPLSTLTVFPKFQVWFYELHFVEVQWFSPFPHCCHAMGSRVVVHKPCGVQCNAVGRCMNCMAPCRLPLGAFCLALGLFPPYRTDWCLCRAGLTDYFGKVFILIEFHGSERSKVPFVQKGVTRVIIVFWVNHWLRTTALHSFQEDNQLLTAAVQFRWIAFTTVLSWRFGGPSKVPPIMGDLFLIVCCDIVLFLNLFPDYICTVGSSLVFTATFVSIYKHLFAVYHNKFNT